MLPETKYKIILKLKILCSPSLCFALRVITLISDKRVIKVIYTFIGCCFMPGDIMTLQVSCLSSNDLMNILLRLSSIFFFSFFFFKRNKFNSPRQSFFLSSIFVTWQPIRSAISTLLVHSLIRPCRFCPIETAATGSRA